MGSGTANRRQTRHHARREQRQPDPARIQQLLRQLEGTPPTERRPLYARLAEHGDDAVTLIARLIRDEGAAHRTQGWAPSDILHVLGRRLSGLHGGVAAYCMTQDDGLAAAAGRDAGWAAELQACVDVAVPPSVSTLQPAHETLCEMRRLPAIHAGRRTRGTEQPEDTMAGLKATMLGKVRGLLAKAESTDFPAEADALTAKAQELIARYTIDRASLADPGTDQVTTTRRILLHGPYLMPKALLVNEVASANRCTSIVFSEFGFCTLFGDPEDLEATDLLVTSLLAQAVRTMTALGHATNHAGRSRTKSFRHSFLQGFAVRIGERLAAASGAALTDSDLTGNVLPVLAAREVAAREAAQAAVPNTHARRTRVSNGDGVVAGRVAADRARLSADRAKLTQPGRLGRQ